MGSFYHIKAVVDNAVMLAKELHHIHGAEMAKEILEKFDYGKEKIAQVQLCVADADAISYFDNLPGLLYLAYVKRNLGIDEGKDFIKATLKRSYETV